MIVYLVRDIPLFVMYCVYGESGSSLLVESNDSMIEYSEPHCIEYCKPHTVYKKEQKIFFLNERGSTDAAAPKKS